MAKSLKELKTDSVGVPGWPVAEKKDQTDRQGQVETYFLHSPDPNTPVEETVEAVQQLYKEGKFKHVRPTFDPYFQPC